METLNAKIREIEDQHFISIDTASNEVLIPLSEDRPTEVKKAFNQLILRLREGPLTVRMQEAGDDLFSQVAQEYVKQLNNELREVRAQMVEYGIAKGD